MARRGKAWHGKARALRCNGGSRIVRAGLGMARFGTAWQGMSRRGKVKATGETQPPFFVGNQNIR
jgi:hypothetical protein